jgi:nucleoside 2-deoxyribosyltransferase
MNKLYLAGPEVFAPNVLEIREQKLAICQTYGFEGIFPFDDDLPNLPKQELGFYIGRTNKNKIKLSNGVIANITPFRGVSADVGTVFEIGYADGLGLPIFAYSNTSEFFLNRNMHMFNAITDLNGWILEDFDLIDNLMIDTSIIDSTNTLIYSVDNLQIDNLLLFEETVARAKFYFAK